MNNVVDGKILPRMMLAGRDLLGFDTVTGDPASAGIGAGNGDKGNDARLTKADIAKSGKGAAGKASLAKSGKAANGKKACLLVV